MDNQQLPPNATAHQQTDTPQLDNNIAQHCSNAPWQKLAPIAMSYFFVQLCKNAFSHSFFLIPTIIFGYKHIIENPWLWLPLLTAILLVVATAVFLSFYFFQYRLTHQHIEIRSGVFSKKHINLPFTRIQNVTLEQPIYYRFFGYTCLTLDTAGSAQQEARIVALKLSFAEDLKKEILTTPNAANSTSIATEGNLNPEKAIQQGSHQQEIVLNTRALPDLIIHGITNNRIWIFLGGLAPFFDDMAAYINQFLKDFGVNIEQLLTFAEKSWWQISLWAVSLSLLILLPIMLFSIIGSIITFYHYTLSKSNDRYIRRSGLFTKHEVTMKLARLQMVYQQQDWLDVLLNRINLTFEQNQITGNNLSKNSVNKIMVPSITALESQILIDDVFPKNSMGSIFYNRISRRFLLRYIGYVLTPILLIASCLLIIADKTSLLSYVIPAYLLLSGLVYCRWKRWGFARDNQFIYIRKGLFGVDYYCFPVYKVQQTKFKQSIFLKRQRLCSLSIVLASGAMHIPYLPQQQGYEIINDILYQVEKSRRSWM